MCFRVVLSFSRKAYSEAFFKQDTESWLAGWRTPSGPGAASPRHCKSIIPSLRSNMRNYYDPELHPFSMAFCQHYGTVLLPIKSGPRATNGKPSGNIAHM